MTEEAKTVASTTPTHALLSKFIDVETAKKNSDLVHVRGGGLATHSWPEDGNCAVCTLGLFVEYL